MTCEFCVRAAGLHDFRRACCRVRYLLALPAGGRWRATRRAWLDRWGVEYGPEAMAQAENEVMAAWQAHRDQARAALDALRSKIAQERTT